MYELVIIGAGAVGLGLGRYFQVERGWRCLLVESEAAFGQGISARNSEVIHAGLYYPSGSLKAELCVSGRERLVHYLKQRDLPFRQCGKYVLAAPEAEAQLEQLYQQARDNGAGDVTLLERGAVRQIYAELSPFAALYSPNSGILSADAFMHQLAGEFQAAGGDLALQTAFRNMTPSGDGFEIALTDAAGETVAVPAERVINAAGLGALDVAGAAGFDYAGRGYRLRMCKGSYFRVPGARGAFKHLIYPLPTDNSLGIHLRFDLLDEVRLGPDAEYLDAEEPDFIVDPQRAADFRTAVEFYWPGIAAHTLEPDWAGVRPHIYRDGEYLSDFIIRDEAEAGSPGWVNMFGIDSPGLTATLAFGPWIAGLWGEGQ